MDSATLPEARVPERIGRYIDLHILGRGGMGAVYRGYDPELDRPVAVKVMLHSTPDFVARFRREAQAIARLTHGNVVQVFDFGVDTENNPYFVMELVEGTPLDALLKDRGRLPTADAIEIARQSALGLAAAHRAGIIHRDVKPSNLIVDARGGVKIVDFGIARASSGAQLTTAASLMGTPGYMSPEQAQGKPVDLRADIYALGLTLFEMVSGTAPFHADDPIALVVMNMQEPLPDLRARPLGLPEELIALIEQMAQKDPNARVQSCDAVVRALEVMQGGPNLTPGLGLTAPANASSSSPSVPPTNVYQLPTDHAPRRRPALAIGAALAIGGIGVGALLLFGPQKGSDVPKPIEIAVAVEKKAPEPAKAESVLVAKTDAPNTDVAKTDPAGAAGHKTTELAMRPVVKDGPLKVAVLKFKNLSGDKSLDALEQGIGETTLNAMASVVGKRAQLIERNAIELDIAELDRAKDAHFDVSTMPQLGKLQGVDVAIQGGYQMSGKLLRITARFVKVETGVIIETATAQGKKKDILDQEDEIAKQLSDKLLLVVDRERPLKSDK